MSDSAFENKPMSPFGSWMQQTLGAKVEVTRVTSPEQLCRYLHAHGLASKANLVEICSHSAAALEAAIASITAGTADPQENLARRHQQLHAWSAALQEVQGLPDDVVSKPRRRRRES